ncbi:MAG: RloB domain-containing protein [Bacteroidaceae bacterium]|nr:RloB domain-containing protein [Bacteroidaceae bacterium]
MSGVKQTTLVIGEGITEFFFLNSLKDDYPILRSVSPDSPKNTSVEELEVKIEKSIKYYNRIFCIIDMDNKQGVVLDKYLELKAKYHKKAIKNDSEGIDCYIQFFETDCCSEVFFLYYFEYTTRKFSSYEEVKIALRRYCDYDKTIKFFKNHPPHKYFEKQGGNLGKAIENAQKSCLYRAKTDADCSFSELGEMFELLLK